MKDKRSYHLTPSIDRLTLRLILPEEQERFNDLLIQHHYLHSAGSAGETLRYVEAVPNPRGFGWKPDTDINLRHVM